MTHHNWFSILPGIWRSSTFRALAAMADGSTRRHGHGRTWHQGYYQRHILSWWWWISLILSDASCHLAYSSCMFIFQHLAWCWHEAGLFPMLGMEKPLGPVGRWNVPRRTAIAEDLPTTWCARWFANTKSAAAVRSQGAPLLLLLITAFCWAGTTGISIEGNNNTSQTYGIPMNFQVILVGEPLKRYDAKRQNLWCSIFWGVRVNWLKCKK